jgi:phosphoribosylanthranilate isomerase
MTGVEKSPGVKEEAKIRELMMRVGNIHDIA